MRSSSVCAERPFFENQITYTKSLFFLSVSNFELQILLHGEFDPGSELTLVACLSHASRTRKPSSEGEYSGERVSNTWVTCLRVGDNTSNEVLIPNNKLSSCGGFKGGLYL